MPAQRNLPQVTSRLFVKLSSVVRTVRVWEGHARKAPLQIVLPAQWFAVSVPIQCAYVALKGISRKRIGIKFKYFTKIFLKNVYYFLKNLDNFYNFFYYFILSFSLLLYLSNISNIFSGTNVFFKTEQK